MTWECPKCGEAQGSKIKLIAHLTLNHDSYEDGTDIREKIAKLMNKVRPQVYATMLKFPQTCNEDKELQQKVYQRYYNDLLIFDSIRQKIKPRNCTCEQGGWTFEEWNRFPNFETLIRRRAEFQKEAAERINAGKGKPEDYAILASEKVRKRRGISESVWHGYYSEKVMGVRNGIA